MNTITKKILITNLLIISLISFYYINNKNYDVYIDIRNTLINHPENLPTKEVAINTSFGYKNLKADIYWLETIQYIGSNAISSEYKKYLFIILDTITELNPYFEHPYSIGQLLLPSYNKRYENLSENEQESDKNDAIKLGLKGIKNFCDPNKIELIKKETDLQKIWTDEKYKNPCSEFKIPYYLAYIYYQFKKDPATAALYYKIASAIEGIPSGTKVMAGIMSGKGGDREKAYFMFLNMAKTINIEDEQCTLFAGELEKLGFEVFINKRLDLTGEILQNIKNTRVNVFGEFSEENENEILSDTQCSNYVNKSIRELNLEYIERANEKYLLNEGINSIDAKVLFDKGYIDYLPVDFQQYKGYGIIYRFNNDTGNYDYVMGNYKL